MKDSFKDYIYLEPKENLNLKLFSFNLSQMSLVLLR
jgi:hypothetical protein